MMIYMMDTIQLIFRERGQDYLEKEILPRCVPMQRVTKKDVKLEYLVVREKKGNDVSPENS